MGIKDVELGEAHIQNHMNDIVWQNLMLSLIFHHGNSPGYHKINVFLKEI